MKYLKSKKIIAGLFICMIISSGLFAKTLASVVIQKMPEIETKPVRPLVENHKNAEDLKDGKNFERPDMPRPDRKDWDKAPDFKGKRPGPGKDFHAKPEWGKCKCCNPKCCDCKEKEFKKYDKKDFPERHSGKKNGPKKPSVKKHTGKDFPKKPFPEKKSIEKPLKEK